jgi:hypothetical protein
MWCVLNMRYLSGKIVSGLIFLSLLVISCKSFNSEKKLNSEQGNEKVRAYFIDGINGNDRNAGTRDKPLKTIQELNIRLQKKVSSVFFAGGQAYQGTLNLKNIHGTGKNPVFISSTGTGRALINGGDKESIHIENCSFIDIRELDLKGKGRKGGNTSNGLAVSASSACRISNVSASGFQISGVDLFDCTETEIKNVIATDNGFSGINVMGSERKKSARIIIQGCRAENNPGDPAILDNHSGNGILIGVSDSVLIDHCTATNNGWDMPRIGNGPVGIWAWESNRVLIQYCISYRNKTSKNASDGGGFDLDGGVTNSIIQYCLSYENQGAGYGLFQYSGASDWSNNVVRFCVSINDAATTKGAGSIFIWNGSDDSKQMINCLIYNNVFYNTATPVISFEKASAHKDFRFMNNIFMGVDELILGNIAGSIFLGNDWWNAGKDIKFSGFKNVNEWAKATGQEMLNGKMEDMQVDPLLKGPFTTDITDPWKLDKLEGYVLNLNSPLKNRGVDLKSVFGIDLPLTDFYGNDIPDGNANEPGIFQMK